MACYSTGGKGQRVERDGRREKEEKKKGGRGEEEEIVEGKGRGAQIR